MVWKSQDYFDYTKEDELFDTQFENSKPLGNFQNLFTNNVLRKNEWILNYAISHISIFVTTNKIRNPDGCIIDLFL
jgi:hypothetical protein